MPQAVDLPPLLFVAGFAAIWIAVVALISIAGGWHALARRYAARDLPTGTGESFRFASLSIGRGKLPANYGGVIFARLGPRGLHLSVFPVFRPMHPPLLIPWSAVAEATREKFLWQSFVALHLREPKVRLMFQGRLGEAIHDYVTRQQPLHGG
jgi:hypothetical protein